MPSIPSCMVNCIEIVVLSPGLRAIEPMASWGGQHPSTTSMKGSLVNRSVWSPTLVSWKDT